MRPLTVSLLAVLLAACSKSGDTAGVQQKIKSWLAAPPFSAEVVSVSCPQQVTYAKGVNFQCSAEVKDAGDWIVLVEMKDDRGEASTKLRDPAIASRKLEEIIQTHLEKTKELKVRADCGPPLRKAEPNTSFPCRLLEGSEPRAVVEVTIKNQQGEVDWALRDLELVSAEQLEARIAQEMRDKGLKAKLDCGQRFRFSVKGSRFDCKVVDETGASGKVVVSVNDDKANVSWKLVDGAPAADSAP